MPGMSRMGPLQALGDVPQSWALLALLGVLAAVFIVLLMLNGSARRPAQDRRFAGDEELPSATLRGYALALVDAGRLSDAEGAARTHLTRMPSDVRMRALLAALLTAQSDHAQAAAEYDRALQIAQRTWEKPPAYLAPYLGCLHGAYATALQALGRAAQAETHQQQALALDHTLTQPGIPYARLLADYARDDELERRAFEDLAQWEHGSAIPVAFGIVDPREAVSFYRAAMAANRNSARLHGNLGQALLASGDRRGAEQEFQEALRLDANDAWLHFQHGLLLWRGEHLPEADRELAEAARLAPRRASVRGTRGVFYLRYQRYSEAEQELYAAVSARPDVFALVQLYGSIALRQGKLQQAARAFEEADRLGANDVAFRLAYADLCEQLGDESAAESQYRLAMRLDTETGITRASYGGFLFRRGRLLDGEQALRQALLLPGSEAAHLQLVRLLLLERRLDEVVSHLDAALQADPGSGSVKEAQAEWLLLRRRAAEADNMTHQLLQTEPPRASLQLVRGGALLALGRQLEAQAALREAVRLDPQLPDRLLVYVRALRDLGRIGAALEAAGQALALRPEWPEALAERDELLAVQVAERRPRRRQTFGPQRR